MKGKLFNWLMRVKGSYPGRAFFISKRAFSSRNRGTEHLDLPRLCTVLEILDNFIFLTFYKGHNLFWVQ